MKRKAIYPKYDRIYTHKDGGQYKRPDPMTAPWMDKGPFDSFPDGFWLENINSGWICFCWGVAEYEDGTIDWNYSTNGFFKNRL